MLARQSNVLWWLQGVLYAQFKRWTGTKSNSVSTYRFNLYVAILGWLCSVVTRSLRHKVSGKNSIRVYEWFAGILLLRAKLVSVWPNPFGWDVGNNELCVEFIMDTDDLNFLLDMLVIRRVLCWSVPSHIYWSWDLNIQRFLQEDWYFKMTLDILVYGLNKLNSRIERPPERCLFSALDRLSLRN